jgi:hypothetical protein
MQMHVFNNSTLVESSPQMNNSEHSLSATLAADIGEELGYYCRELPTPRLSVEQW